MRVRAVQISELVDPVVLILLDRLPLQPGIAKPGWGSGGVDLETCCPSICDKTPDRKAMNGFQTVGQISAVLKKGEED